ncbi:uncharacterized protein SRS1_17404 [Sporisorium reilianum f. sp. reilianum]|uniref:Uncharacterized protein n=1 Tax=Sporisorium reilianum f. sp. reilianum TaxID=72559 RepID=A0A2N8UBX7_9BASI|nr:uncharacterized protein SRS1_17404 [Sporisorium reilianum f. sp. reilianum]
MSSSTPGPLRDLTREDIQRYLEHLKRQAGDVLAAIRDPHEAPLAVSKIREAVLELRQQDHRAAKPSTSSSAIPMAAASVPASASSFTVPTAIPSAPLSVSSHAAFIASLATPITASSFVSSIARHAGTSFASAPRAVGVNYPPALQSASLLAPEQRSITPLDRLRSSRRILSTCPLRLDLNVCECTYSSIRRVNKRINALL